MKRTGIIFILLALMLSFGVAPTVFAKTKQKPEVVEQSYDDTEISDSEEGDDSAPPPKTYSQEEYEQVYRDLDVPTFSFIHGKDPEEYYDMKDTAWSPYPLMRLNSPIYFKSITIMPGYYLLTPRRYKGDWYILFKEAGRVVYTIPVFEKTFHDPEYYHTHLKELDMKPSQRWTVKFLNNWGKTFRRSKRRPATQTNIELTDLDNNFLLIELHYGPNCYKSIFRTEKF